MACTRAPRRLVFNLGAAFALGLVALGPPAAHGADALVGYKSLSPEIALKAVQGAMVACRKAGYQVAVAVVDRSGLIQAQWRDRFAGAHTIEVSYRKAWTAASFRIPSGDLARETASGRPMAGIRSASRVLALGGGLPIAAAGSTVGAIGVSGAPGGEADEMCAKAGIDAIRDDIEF